MDLLYKGIKVPIFLGIIQSPSASWRMGLAITNKLINYLLPKVIPCQSSVLNGEAGKPAELYKLQIGFEAQA